MADENNPKIIDVTKPGQSAPDASARPIIVSHRPIVKDPMVSAGGKTDPDTSSAIELVEGPSTIHAGNNIEPSAELKAQTEAQAKTKNPPVTTDKPKSDSAVKSEDSKKEDEAPKSSDAAAVETVAGETQTKKETEKLEAEEKAKQEALEKLIESKQYFVPIGQAKKASSSRVAVVLLIVIILAAVGFDLAVDAGLIKTDLFVPPIDLIKN